MKELNEELKELGFSDELIRVVNSTENLNNPSIDIRVEEFQTYEDTVISTNSAIVNTVIQEEQSLLTK